MGTYNDKFDIESVEYYDIYGNKFTDKGILKTIKIIRESECKNNIINNITSRSSNLREQEEIKGEEFKNFSKKYIGSTISSDYSVVYKLSDQLYNILSMTIDDGRSFISYSAYVYETKKLWKRISISND